jgi:hypothetical protein
MTRFVEQAQGLQRLSDAGPVLDRLARLERERPQQSLRREPPAEVSTLGPVGEDGVLTEQGRLLREGNRSRAEGDKRTEGSPPPTDECLPTNP